ncbi:MAG: glycosyltransferase [Alphaproteobacteria bacterium]|nr:glycosyltransferase [Alphaproteobacteria bacterium]
MSQDVIAPQITVIIAAYNCESTIARAITSALQEPEVGQVIVVDDASGDNSVAAAKACDDGSDRLLVLQQVSNAGPSAARNRALDATTMPWVGVLDSDDFFVEGRMATLLAHKDKADFIADDMWQVSEEDINGARTALLGESLTKPLMVDFEHFVLSNVTNNKRQRNELGFIKPLMRREFLQKHNLRYQEAMRLGEDFELYARALALGAKLLLIPTQGYVSVVRSNSLSGQHSIEDLRHLRDSDNILQQEVPLNAMQEKALQQHYKSIDCRLQWRLLIEAVKQRSLSKALCCFRHSWAVRCYLLHQLLLQSWLRLTGKGPE